MNKSELINAMAEKTELTKGVCKTALEGFIDVVTQELVKGGDVTLVGFGKFSTKTRAARTGVNPRTGESMDVPESVVPKFKFGKNVKDMIQNAQSE